MDVHFIIRQTDGKSKKFKLSDGEYVVLGRSKNLCQVPLDDELCSGTHCKVSLSNNAIFVEDMNSKNGLYLNGVRILKQRTFIDDKIKLGESYLYINPTRMEEESINALTYKGEHGRGHGSFTLELDSDIVNKANAATGTYSKKAIINSELSEARRKAYATVRKSGGKAKMTRKKLQILETGALLIDIAISILIFYVATRVTFRMNPEYYNLMESVEGMKIYTHEDMRGFTFFSTVVGFLFFSITRRLSSGSIGERILKIS